MATVTITLPTGFIQNCNQFMANVQKMNQLAQQMNQTIKRMPAVRSLYRAHMFGRFNKLLQTLRKISAAFQKALDSIINTLGTISQTLLRSLAVVSEVLGPIIGAMITTGAVVGTVAIQTIALGSRLMRWIWDKMIAVGDSMLEDYLLSSGAFTTIGGLRAFRTTLGGFVDTEHLIRQMAGARGYVASSKFTALQMLGIKRFSDTTEMMIDATIAASRFMKAQQAGTELVMADALAITSLFNPDELLRLKEVSEDELQAYKKLYQNYKPLMEVTDKAKFGWINFTLQVKAAGVTIQSVIARVLANPDHPFTQSVKELIQSLTYFFQVLAKAPITKEIVDLLKHWLDEFSKYLRDPQRAKDLEDVMHLAGDITREAITAIGLLRDIIRMWSPSTRLTVSKAPASRVQVYRPGIRRPGAVRPDVGAEPFQPGTTVFRPHRQIRGRPEPIPRIAPSKVPLQPGTTVFRPHRQIPGRPAPISRIPPTTGTFYQKPSLRAPTSPAEAPETVEAATKGGFRRAEGGGIYDRSGFAKELAENPALRQKVAAIALAEGGTDPEAQKAVVESMMNRARVRGQKLEQTARWTNEPGGYYSAEGKNRGEGMARTKSASGANKSIDDALSGSRTIGTATDNSSNQPGNNLADRDMAGGKFRLIRKLPNGEYYFERVSEDKKRARLSKDESKPGSMQPMTVDDIQKGLNAKSASSKGNVPAPSGESRLTTVGNYRSGGDPRRDALIGAAAEASKNLPPGWKVEAYSGQRTQGPHSTGAAVDFRLIDPNGHSIENYQHPENFAVYERFAQDTHLSLQKTNPELAAQHRWGGYFSGTIDPSGQDRGTYGAMDLMHQDFAGGNSRMAAGQWESGVNAGWRERWGVGEHSPGIAARIKELQDQAVKSAQEPKPEEAKPEEKASGPVMEYGSGPTQATNVPVASPVKKGMTQEEAVAWLRGHSTQSKISDYSKEIDSYGKTMPSHVKFNLLTAAQNTNGEVLKDDKVKSAIKSGNWDDVNTLATTATAQKSIKGERPEIRIRMSDKPEPEKLGEGGPDYESGVGRRNFANRVLPERSPLRQKVKVDNRSDMDVHHSDSHSDNDSGSNEKLDEMVPTDL